jgi:hypothetical protein
MAKESFCSFGVHADAVAGWIGTYGGENSPADISRLFAGEVATRPAKKLEPDRPLQPPMPPIRPADLDAINALASLPQSLQASPPPQSGPIDPSIAARTAQVGAMANPPQLQPRYPHPRNVVRAAEQLFPHWSRRPASKLHRCHGCEIAAAAGKYGFGATKAVAPNLLT